MKLVRAAQGRFVFFLGLQEQRLLLEVLQQYPLTPLGHHRASRRPGAGATESHDKLLAEAMAALQDEQKTWVRGLMADAGRIPRHGAGFHLGVSREELERLLQILNDVRVGCWLALGCPDPDEGKAPAISAASAGRMFLMELSGHFEAAIVKALGGRDDD